MSNITNAQLAAQINALITSWTTSQQQFAAWLAGVVGGGPNSNGTYPLSDYLGNTSYVSSPAQLASTVTAQVNSASSYATAASSSATAAATSATNAANSATGASSSASNAVVSATNASNSAAAAASSAASAQSAKTGLTNAVNAASASATAAASSATAASTSATNASSSASAAATSATNAANSATLAATFNPALYAALAGATFTGAVTVNGALAASGGSFNLGVTTGTVAHVAIEGTQTVFRQTLLNGTSTVMMYFDGSDNFVVPQPASLVGSSIFIGGPLTVGTSGTNQATQLNGALTVTGTVSGAGITSLLSPYLTSATASSTYAALAGSNTLTGNNLAITPSSWTTTFGQDSTQWLNLNGNATLMAAGKTWSTSDSRMLAFGVASTGHPFIRAGGLTLDVIAGLFNVTCNTAITGTLSVSSTVSGAGITSLLAPYAPLASPAFTGTASFSAFTASGSVTFGVAGANNGVQTIYNGHSGVAAGDLQVHRTSTTANSVAQGTNIWLYDDAATGGVQVGIQAAGQQLEFWSNSTGSFVQVMRFDSTGQCRLGGNVAYRNASARTTGNITFSTAAPSGGSDGDIWFQHA